MVVRVRLFALLRERAGSGSLELDLAEGATVADAIAAAGERDGLGELIERMPVVMAVNREYAPETAPLSEGDELALIPPVSGGAPDDDGDASARSFTRETTVNEQLAGKSAPRQGRVHARVTAKQLSLEAVAARVRSPAAGATVTFQGTTREVDRLEYEAYAEMAEERIAAILAECLERHGLEGIAAEHRTGTVPLGEPSVIVAASAAHRGGAFAGAREAIDRIKSEAPIWKREVEDGEGRWVEGSAPVPDAEAVNP